jgi:hypothetical protein
MKDKLVIWKLIILFIVMLLIPQVAQSATYTFAYWNPGLVHSSGEVHPDEDGDCMAYLRASYYPWPGDPIYGHIRYEYEDAEIKAYLTSEGLDLGIYHMHAHSTIGYGHSWAKAIAREEFTLGGPGGPIDALMNLELTGTLFITDTPLHFHQNTLRVLVSVRRASDNEIVGSFNEYITVWNDPSEPSSPGYGYIDSFGVNDLLYFEFISYTHDPYIIDPVPFGPIPGNGKMLIFNKLPINVPIEDLITGEDYYYIVEMRNDINYQGATDTFQTLNFSSSLPAIQFGHFGSAPEPGDFTPVPDQEVFAVQSESGALGDDTVEGDLQVDINIKPGSDENKLNLKSKGIIPVVIITTQDFDATTVDPDTVEFGPDGALGKHGKEHVEDVDGDGDLDLALHFKTQETGIECGDAEAWLTGETYDGQYFEGSGNITTVGCD